MIEVIAEHSVDTSLIPARAYILDAGCRGMIFTNEMRRRGHEVLALDCDRLENEVYMQLALSNKNCRVGVKHSSDPQATTICNGDGVDCVTLAELNDMFFNKDFVFDLIKLDIEGSEYEVIMSMDRQYAKQLSIEFHLHTGVYGEREMIEMENVLFDLGYTFVKHEKSKQHGMGYNYWDSLFIL